MINDVQYEMFMKGKQEKFLLLLCDLARSEIMLIRMFGFLSFYYKCLMWERFYETFLLWKKKFKGRAFCESFIKVGHKLIRGSKEYR
jgi:hypothetical protein